MVAVSCGKNNHQSKSGGEKNEKTKRNKRIINRIEIQNKI